MRARELNNGRVAMLAIVGFAAQEEIDKRTIWEARLLLALLAM